MNYKKGFTLIELIVVITIIGFLVSIVFVSFNGARAQSRDQKRISDIASIQLALEQYFNKNGRYPISTSLLVPGFLVDLPTPPKPTVDTAYNYVPISSVSNTTYCISHQLWATMEKTSALASTTKKGFDSDTSLVSPATIQVCSPLASAPKVHSSTNKFIYDVMPQF